MTLRRLLFLGLIISIPGSHSITACGGSAVDAVNEADAGADIFHCSQRRFWEPIEQRCEDFERLELPSSPQHGGALILCTGRKR